jgi:CarboxypepD_reg-like domain
MSYLNFFEYSLMKFLVLSIVYVPAYSQIFKGRVLDAATGQVLQYANIGVTGKNIGGISFQNGEFAIDLSGADKQDVVRISYIGYEPRAIVISSLELSQHHTIRLSPKSVRLDPIVVSEKAETHIIGHQKTGRTFTGWGDFKSLRGRTRGLLIEGAECPVKVKSFFFRINHNDWDSVAFRLNFMNVEDGKEGESLLQKNLIFTTSQRHKWVKVDVMDDNVILCSKAIVTLEWVDAWGKLGEYSNMLTLSLSKSKGQLYSREPGDEVGSLKMADHAPAMYLEVFGK